MNQVGRFNIHSIIIFFWNIIKPYKGYYLLMLIMPVSNALCPILSNYALKWIIDVFSKDEIHRLADCAKPVALFLGSTIFNDLFCRLEEFARLKSLPYISRRINTTTMTHCLKFPYEYFQKNASGFILAKMRGISEQYFQIHSTIFHSFLEHLFITLITLTLLLMSSIYIAFFVLIFLAVYSVLFVFFFTKLAKMEKKRWESWYYFLSKISDVFLNISSVFYFANKKKEIKDVSNYHRNVHSRISQEYIKYDMFISFVLCFIYWLFLGSIFIYAVYLKNNNIITTGGMIFMITNVLLFSNSTWKLGYKTKDLMNQFQAMNSSFSIMNEPINILDEVTANKKIKVIKGELVLKNLYFKYDSDSDKYILNNLNLKINKSEKIGIVGHSGAGKSTIVSLLLKRFYPNKGSIFIDGQDIYKYSTESLIANISIIPQEISMFHRSVRDNIAYAKESASDEEIIQACKIADIHDFIMTLPDQYSTIIGENASKLSGGQKQRVAIARAVLKNAPILILDEATSALDTESENEIQKSINGLLDRVKSTIIVIAHRLSTVKDLDRIIVIENGTIAEEGTFKELIDKKDSKFKYMWDSQYL